MLELKQFYNLVYSLNCSLIYVHVLDTTLNCNQSVKVDIPLKKEISTKLHLIVGLQFYVHSELEQLWFESSSCCAASMDIPDPLLPLFPIFHRFWQVLWATSHILTELLYVGSSWSLYFCSAMCGRP